MALQKSYYKPNLEVKIPDCYWKITKLRGDKNRIEFYLGVFRDKEKADAGIIINEFLYEFVPDLESSDNFIAQAYNYLKTLPNFENAINI